MILRINTDEEQRGMIPSETKRAPTLVLIDDSVTDVKITQRALQLAEVHVELVVLRDGEEALNYFATVSNKRELDDQDPALVGEPLWDGRDTFPDLVLLDLNLPGLSGFEVLEKIRATPYFACLPVVVLSTSSHPEDVRRAYTLGASTYFEKPRELKNFVELLQMLQRYWLEMALLPRF